ncbi:MAG: GRP family sugar transporter, partial [Pseudomonadota bacterium]|nr:GRP family sugar transporter [Pseudomonadota bacterium]
LIGEAGRLGGYLQGRTSWHVLGMLAGALWCSGTVFNFISAGLVGIAISVGVGSGAPMIGALWGVFVWREFATGSPRAKALIASALVLYVIGVAAMSIAYTLR